METLTRHAYAAFGPAEPKGFKDIRDRYHARRRRTEQLEVRIAHTDSGMQWLARVKQIGKRAV